MSASNQRRTLLRMLALALSSFVAACSIAPKQMYEGPRLPPESEVMVSGRTGPFSVGGGVIHSDVLITAVNGKSTLIVLQALGTDPNPYPRSVLVPPGSHELSVKWITGGLWLPSVEGRVRIDAEPGKRYVITGRLAKPYGVPLWATPQKVDIEFYVERHASGGDQR